jgi:hypothetical protein
MFPGSTSWHIDSPPTYRPADDMSDLHMPIINDISKVVCREAVAFQDNVVILGILLSKPVVDNIVDHDRCL